MHPNYHTIAEMFHTTRGGKHRSGRCEACDEILSIDEVGLCQDCEFHGLLEEERDS